MHGLFARLWTRAMQFLRRLFHRLLSARLFARYDSRLSRDSIVPLFYFEQKPAALTIHREVSRNGVRIYSLCGSCGARLEVSATLCEECAKGRSPSAPGF
jgi:hypothetical protein